MEVLFEPTFWTALAALTFLEIVLGIDNIVFIAIAADKLPPEQRKKRRNLGLWLAMALVVTQIVIINVVFSLDSVITAIGMTEIIAVMVLAVVISTIVMLIAASPVASFIEKHPTTKMLALSLILLVGVALIADGLGMHIKRGYIYFAIGFSLLVEFFNILYRRRRALAKSLAKELE